MGDIPSAIAIIVAVLAILNYIWSLLRPDTGIHGALRRCFSKPDLQPIGAWSGVREPKFSIPCAIGIKSGKEDSIRYHPAGTAIIPPQHIHVSPGPHGTIDINKDLGYIGPSLVNKSNLEKVWVAFMLQLRNGSSHAGSMILLESARIEIENYSRLCLCDEKIVILVNSGYGIGGDGGFEVPTHKSNAILSRHGATAYESYSGDNNADDNLLLGKMFGLRAGDIIALNIKVYFAHSGVFKIRLRVDGSDERGRPIAATSDSVTTSVVLASAAELVSRGVRFVDIWQEQEEITDA